MVILTEQVHQEMLDTTKRLADEVEQLKAEIQWLKEQIGLAKHHQFGSSSEKSSSEQIASLFNEAEVCAEPDLPEPAALEQIVTYKRRKAKGQRELDLENLEVVETPYRLPEDQQICPQCSGPLHEMGKEERDEIEHVPATYRIRRHVRYKYACRHCQQEETTTPILAAPMPKPAFPGSLASASSVANIMVQKFVVGTPLYRQEQQFERQGLHLTRQTMANWMIKGAGHLRPLYDKMHEILLDHDIAHADETVLQVLRQPGRAAQSDSYMWLYRSGRDDPPIVLFEYQPTRAGSHPKSFLAGFIGYLHVDGYVAYECLPGVIVLVGCWAHVRRKFDEAIKALPTPARKKAGSAAHVGLGYCNALYEIERDLVQATPDERKAARLERSRPVLDAFKLWLDEQAPKFLSKSLTGKAIGYCRNQWPKLVRFLEDGRLEIDNNRAERSIKPFVMGRKNWLFANTPKGAHASAVIYSLVETAKENGLNPFEYLRTLFERLPNIDPDDPEAITELLPWSQTIQKTCAAPKRRIVESADHDTTVQ